LKTEVNDQHGEYLELATIHEMNQNKYDYLKFIDEKRNKSNIINKIEKSIIKLKNKNDK